MADGGFESQAKGLREPQPPLLSSAFREPQCGTSGTVAFETAGEEPVAEVLEATDN